MADTQLFGTMCTDIGNAAIANSVLTGTKVNFSQIAVGDADGTSYVPVSGMTALKHQVWSGPIAEVSQDPQEANRMILHAVLPSSVGGWVMREIGVLDDKGRLIAIGNTPEIPKEVVTTGAIMEMDLYIYISVVDARGVNVIIDPTVVIASKADVSKLQNEIEGLAGDGRTTETVKGNADAGKAHTTRIDNPHAVTAAQTGAVTGATLGGVEVPKSGTVLESPGLCVRLSGITSGTILDTINAAMMKGYTHVTFGVGFSAGDAPSTGYWGAVEAVKLYSNNSINVIYYSDTVSISQVFVRIINGGQWMSDWVPVSSCVKGYWDLLLNGRTNAGNPTYASKTCTYTRVGKLIYLFGDIQLSSVGGMTGGIDGYGLPFPPVGGSRLSISYLTNVSGLSGPL